MEKRTKIIRAVISIVLVAVILTVYGFRFVRLQIIDGEYYVSQSKSSSKKELDLSASRGEILDTNGNPLVINRTGYSVEFDYAFFPKGKGFEDQRNKIVIELARLIEAQNEQWIDNLPIELGSDGEPQFVQGEDKAIQKLIKDFSLNKTATAKNCLNQMIKSYAVSDEYTLEDKRTIVSILYEMKLKDFSYQTPYVFARDIQYETISKITENSDLFVGVEIVSEPYREYADPTIAPHVLGNVGAIDSNEYEEKKDGEGNYKLNDTIGKSGIEKAMESYLRGQSGKRVITTKDGVSTSEVTQEPVKGNNVILTLDTEIQRIAQNMLKETIDGSYKKYLAESKSGGEIKHGASQAGSVVVVDVNTGGVLAMASHPTYTFDDYTNNYSQLAKDELKPLYNRATSGGYPPGSTFKPAVALAALQENVVNKNTIIKCIRIYTLVGPTYEPKCLGYHSNLNMKQAINVSCNYYFYELGRRAGIEKLNYWEKKLGFGQKTGVEISESSGLLAGVEHNSSLGKVWRPGDTIQSAIGQSDNLVTPIQLANYVATIANGGTRYKTHLVDSVKSADFSQTILKKEPEVANETGISLENIQSVKEGMLMLTTEGNLAKYYGELPFKVGAKTGTAQIHGKVKRNLGMFIAFAPYDNPQIAIGVALEDFKSGSEVTPLTVKIFEAYAERLTGEKPQQEGQLLN